MKNPHTNVTRPRKSHPNGPSSQVAVSAPVQNVGRGTIIVETLNPAARHQAHVKRTEVRGRRHSTHPSWVVFLFPPFFILSFLSYISLGFVFSPFLCILVAALCPLCSTYAVKRHDIVLFTRKHLRRRFVTTELFSL